MERAMIIMKMGRMLESFGGRTLTVMEESCAEDGPDPDMVIVYRPASAVRPALMEIVDATAPPPGFTTTGSNEASRPLGNPWAVRLTLEANPHLDPIVTVAMADSPLFSSRWFGVTEIVKSGINATTASLAQQLWTSSPLVPTTSKSNSPIGDASVVEMVSRDCADPPEGGATEVGEKEEEIPGGRPSRLRFTDSLNPLTDWTDMR